MTFEVRLPKSTCPRLKVLVKVVPSATSPQLRMCRFSGSMCSSPTKRSMPAEAGSAVREVERWMTSSKRTKVMDEPCNTFRFGFAEL